jgi:hypothetical protein
MTLKGEPFPNTTGKSYEFMLVFNVFDRYLVEEFEVKVSPQPLEVRKTVRRIPEWKKSYAHCPQQSDGSSVSRVLYIFMH